MRTPTLVGLIAAATVLITTPATALPKLRPIECAPNCGSYGTILIQNCLTLSGWRETKGIKQPTPWEKKYGCAMFREDVDPTPLSDERQGGLCVSYNCWKREQH